jgi:glutaredoxin-related protein
MRKIIIVFIIVFIGYTGYQIFKPQPAPIPDSEADLILFWGNGCPHCETVKDYISQNKLDTKFKISQKEVYYNKTNQKQLEDTVKLCSEVDISQGIGVPLGYDVKNKLCLPGSDTIIQWLKK